MPGFSIRPAASMWPAMHALKAMRVRFRVVSPHQLKVGKINYWPSSERIFIDGESKSTPDRGLTAFLNLVSSSDVQRNSIRTQMGDLKDADSTPFSLPVIEI